MIEVKYRMRREMVDDNNYDLIDLHPDYRLSSTTRRIPFVNYTDSVRISMGTSMLKQSIPLTNGERPLVDTGNEDDLAENVLNDRYKFDNGEVIRITDKEVVILNTDTGNEISVPRRTAIQSVNNVSVYTEPKVKVGDKVKKGDIIIGAIEIDKDTVRSGLNTNVLFHAYHGLVNEDAVVVSESYAERMSHYSIIDIYIDVKTNSSITWIAPIGTKVKFKDEVVKTRKAVRLDEVNRLVTINYYLLQMKVRL
jgi:DNA-directed RNA polymerase subunit beta